MIGKRIGKDDTFDDLIPSLMQRTAIRALGLVSMALLAGCYPQGPEYIDEYDLVLTNFSPTFDFTTTTTYSLPDSVIKISGDLIDGENPDMVSPVYGDEILDDIRQNMNERGWEEVDEANDPDVILLPSVFTSTTVSYYYDSYYWGWYYPYYGYGWYYPGYYPAYVTSYTTGTLMIQMTDPNDPAASDNIPVVWTAAFNGLAEGSTSGLVVRIDEAIDQAFDQSAYLNH